MPGSYISIFCFFLLLVSGSERCCAQIAYFDQTYDLLSRNLEKGLFLENLSVYTKWTHQPSFRQLSCHQKGLLLHKIGVTYYNLEDEKRAIAIFRETLEQWDNCPGARKSDKANTIYNIGISYQYLNDPYQAGINLDSAMIIFESDPTYPRDQLAMKYFGVANFYNNGFDIYKAESNYKIALQFLENDDTYIGLTFDILNALLTIKLNYHDFEGAVNVWNKAMMVYRSDMSGIDRNTLIHLYLNGGNAKLKLNDHVAAIEHVGHALKMINKEKDPYTYSIALEIRSMVLVAQGNMLEAIRLTDEIIALRKRSLTSNEEYKALSTAYANQAEQNAKLGKFTEALGYVAQAYKYLRFSAEATSWELPQPGRDFVRDELQFVQTMDVHAFVLEEKYKQQKNLHDLESALQLSLKIDTLLNLKMLSIQHEKSKVDFVHSVVIYYERGIERALRLYEKTNQPTYLHHAYYFCAKPKAIVLLTRINEMEAQINYLTAEQDRKKISLVEQLLTLQKALSEDTINQDQHLVSYMQVLREWKKFQRALEQEDPEYYRKKNALIDPLQMEQIRERLPKDMAHLEYFYGDSAIYVFCISREGIVYDRISSTEALVASCNAFISACRRPDLKVDMSNAHFLYEQLLGTSTGKMPEGINRIQIIPDGILFKIAFEALPVSQGQETHYVLEDYAISYAYAAVLAQPKPKRKYNIPYTGFFTDYSTQLNTKLIEKGRLDQQERLAPLSISGREVEFGAGFFNGEEYSYQEASKTKFMSSAPQSEIVHLSLHGLEDEIDPWNSSILFDDRTDDFVLTAADLYGKHLDTDLVILSTCHSGSGKIYGGEGVEGITKAFVLSGANTVVSSLWQAVEGSTFRIVTSFFKNLKKGDPLDTALANAKKAYLQGAEPHMKHPYYWAHFIVLGDTSSRYHRNNSPLILLFLGLAFAGYLIFRVRGKRRPA